MSLRQALVFIPIVVLLAVAYVASQSGLADLYAKQPRYKIKLWQKNAQRPELREWRAVLESIRFAHQLEPSNPAIVEDLARVYFWGAANEPTDNSEWIEFQQQALAYSRLAVRRTPTSPYAWSNVALAKLRLGQIDTDLFHAMKLAVMLGPWETPVQGAVADVGLAAWVKLPDDIRTLVQETIERGIKYQPSRMLQIAQTHRQVSVLCNIKVAYKTLPLESCNH